MRVNPIAAQDQGRHYAEQLGVPFVFLSNGEEVWFLDRETDAHARKIATFYSPDELERRIAARRNRLELSSVEIDGGSSIASTRLRASRPCPPKCHTDAASCSWRWRQAADDVARALQAGQLPQAEGDELRPAAHHTESLALLVPPGLGRIHVGEANRRGCRKTVV